MSRLIETIRLEDGQFGNLRYHQQRVDITLNQLFPGSNKLNLAAALEKESFPKQGLYKCRVVYDSTICQIQYEPYSIRPVVSLKIVKSDTIDYHFKWENRSALVDLMQRKETADDILIVNNGMVTDTSYSNIAFEKKNGDWITPSSYLLNGTMRQYLIECGKIKEEHVRVEDIYSFDKFKLINAMLRWDGTEVDITNIS